jgi:hypothetical protein
VQDGTAKANLELKNEKCIKAFGITDSDLQRFKEYCLKHQTFIHPSSTYNFQYRDILAIFKKAETWSQLLFYCKPFCKV